MKRLIIVLLVLLLVLSGCATDDYSGRIESLESAVASQALQIEALQDALSSPAMTTSPVPSTEITPAPTVEPEPPNYKEYADVGPEVLFKFLPTGFVHLFSEESVSAASLCYNGTEYYIELLYDTNGIDQHTFDAFLSGITDVVESNWDGDSGSIFTPKVTYHIYEYYEGGVILRTIFQRKPEGADVYLESSLVDYDAYLLPELLTPPSNEIRITFSKDSYSVDTILTWNGLTGDAVEQIAAHYRDKLAGNEWYNLEALYARLDDYRAIHVKSMQGSDGYTVEIHIYNFTIDSDDAR